MKPGETARPLASTVRVAGPLSLPISAILPFRTPTSPRNAGMPEPSTTRPFLISRSYAIWMLSLDLPWGFPIGILPWARAARRGTPPSDQPATNNPDWQTEAMDRDGSGLKQAQKSCLELFRIDNPFSLMHIVIIPFAFEALGMIPRTPVLENLRHSPGPQ